ncbi:hypothetical protein OXPF_39150 [Oxobacter pfennigii]|uniref:Uncharacterized protein n=1 Tax=Oxobacter pfennigii TaxID=36849 RepID=A0A0N8NSI6_9CLOT|nr:type I-C CRISPR-associated protein Cas8c/Csd1 [Oxobacter pfennigii]KPU42136.1 hypothetical protein OXPF_39150 [Oxobacter pfennigii]
MVDNTIKDRSYCFGRLMALTQFLELNVPPIAKEGRTLIDQEWSNIVKYPIKWHDVHARVLSTRVSDKVYKAKTTVEDEITYIVSEIINPDDFMSAEPLEPSYTLGYSQQSMDIKSWGGYREGAGRPSTGRKKKNIYVTDEEYEQVQAFIQQIRQNG